MRDKFNSNARKSGMKLVLQILLVVVLLWFAGWLIWSGWRVRRKEAAE